ncbi:cytochrome c family protein [Rhodoblastus sphagnicola]|uniref:Cytochrome c family protein n=1 Tax=Rhodoblastus sphagnicola TaxID=333368 RepID=A0A2S6N346_9HYPH|nr:cytochrome c family protein [Rhodoblastus sphagnicola]MBB4199141.1 cytochrome c [Rhodoblastus sphagnicola]PPQ29030.1 cytochrome c family protein [Rhodoblastus sphagnicola]
MKLIHALSAAAVLAFASSSAFAAGDPDAGQKVFLKCAACHKIGPGAKNGVGPSLNGIAGRKSGQSEGFTYSDANKNSGITWDEATFKEYITAPQKKVPGTKMTFPGLPAEGDRDNVWAYISQFKADGSK